MRKPAGRLSDFPRRQHRNRNYSEKVACRLPNYQPAGAGVQGVGRWRYTYLEINTVLPGVPKFEFQKEPLESGPGYWMTIDHNYVLVGHDCRIRSKATPPCVAAYNYARIRRLVRLGPGLYRFRVAANLATRTVTGASALQS
jgi:hypothetical protein